MCLILLDQSQMKIKIEKKIFLFIACILTIYILFCDMVMSFSITMNIVFFAGVILLLLLYFTSKSDEWKEENPPSFIDIFAKVSSILYFGIMLLIICFNIIYPKNHIPKGKNFDYVIVFGAGISKGKNEIINSRLDTAIKFANENIKSKFVLTGAKGGDEPIAEAVYMKNYMVKRGINQNRIVVDPFSVNTSENIINSLNLIIDDVMRRNRMENIIPRPFKRNSKRFDMDFINIGFMSNGFHLTRINMMARKCGIVTPYDIKCHTNPLYIPYLYVRENLSLFKAFALSQLKF